MDDLEARLADIERRLGTASSTKQCAKDVNGESSVRSSLEQLKEMWLQSPSTSDSMAEELESQRATLRAEAELAALENKLISGKLESELSRIRQEQAEAELAGLKLESELSRIRQEQAEAELAALEEKLGLDPSTYPPDPLIPEELRGKAMWDLADFEKMSKIRKAASDVKREAEKQAEIEAAKEAQLQKYSDIWQIVKVVLRGISYNPQCTVTACDDRGNICVVRIANGRSDARAIQHQLESQGYRKVTISG